MHEKEKGSSSRKINPTDKRRSKRVELEAVVHYEINGSEFINLSSNISAEGIFIRNLAPPTVGTELRIRVQMPVDLGAVTLDLLGRVIHVVDNVGEENRGMGVEFESVQADTLEAVRYFVNAVYGIHHLSPSEVHPNGQTGRYIYTPGPSESLRIHPNLYGYQPIRPPEPSGKLIQYMLLVLVGVLLGSGMVLFFFLF